MRNLHLHVQPTICSLGDEHNYMFRRGLIDTKHTPGKSVLQAVFSFLFFFGEKIQDVDAIA